MSLLEFVTHVAETGFGEVDFYLPTQEIDTFSKENDNPSPSSPGFTKLKDSLVAVKKIKKTYHDKAVTELEALQAIRVVPNEYPDAHFSKLKSNQFIQDGVGWKERECLVLEAIVPVIQLSDILSTELRVPILLVYHLFLSLGSAVRFLREDAKWAHQDIKEDNILVRRGPNGLPEFVLIDFGNAVKIEDLRYPSNDCKRCFEMVVRLANLVNQQRHEQQEQELQSQEQQGWVDFVNMLREQTKGTKPNSQVDDDFEDTWRSWSEVARKARDKRMDVETAGIEKILDKAQPMGAPGIVEDGEVIDAVTRYVESKKAQS